ncbi:nucleoside transporter C-terminal domain-containing protein, partial [Escherichia coli]
LNRLIRCVCGKKIGPDPRNFNQRVCLGRNDLLIRTFPNFGSIGVVVGAFSAISPKRAPEIAQLGLRALAAATLSNLMSATIAGFFIGLA